MDNIPLSKGSLAYFRALQEKWMESPRRPIEPVTPKSSLLVTGQLEEGEEDADAKTNANDNTVLDSCLDSLSLLDCSSGSELLLSYADQLVLLASTPSKSDCDDARGNGTVAVASAADTLTPQHLENHSSNNQRLCRTDDTAVELAEKVTTEACSRRREAIGEPASSMGKSQCTDSDSSRGLEITASTVVTKQASSAQSPRPNQSPTEALSVQTGDHVFCPSSDFYTPRPQSMLESTQRIRSSDSPVMEAQEIAISCLIGRTTTSTTTNTPVNLNPGAISPEKEESPFSSSSTSNNHFKHDGVDESLSKSGKVDEMLYTPALPFGAKRHEHALESPHLKISKEPKKQEEETVDEGNQVHLNRIPEPRICFTCVDDEHIEVTSCSDSRSLDSEIDSSMDTKSIPIKNVEVETKQTVAIDSETEESCTSIGGNAGGDMHDHSHFSGPPLDPLNQTMHVAASALNPPSVKADTVEDSATQDGKENVQHVDERLQLSPVRASDSWQTSGSSEEKEEDSPDLCCDVASVLYISGLDALTMLHTRMGEREIQRTMTEEFDGDDFGTGTGSQGCLVIEEDTSSLAELVQSPAEFKIAAPTVGPFSVEVSLADVDSGDSDPSDDDKDGSKPQRTAMGETSRSQSFMVTTQPSNQESASLDVDDEYREIIQPIVELEPVDTAEHESNQSAKQATAKAAARTLQMQETEKLISDSENAKHSDVFSLPMILVPRVVALWSGEPAAVFAQTTDQTERPLAIPTEMVVAAEEDMTGRDCTEHEHGVEVQQELLPMRVSDHSRPNLTKVSSGSDSSSEDGVSDSSSTGISSGSEKSMNDSSSVSSEDDASCSDGDNSSTLKESLSSEEEQKKEESPGVRSCETIPSLDLKPPPAETSEILPSETPTPFVTQFAASTTSDSSPAHEATIMVQMTATVAVTGGDALVREVALAKRFVSLELSLIMNWHRFLAIQRIKQARQIQKKKPAVAAAATTTTAAAATMLSTGQEEQQDAVVLLAVPPFSSLTRISECEDGSTSSGEEEEEDDERSRPNISAATSTGGNADQQSSSTTTLNNKDGLGETKKQNTATPTAEGPAAVDCAICFSCWFIETIAFIFRRE